MLPPVIQTLVTDVSEGIASWDEYADKTQVALAKAAAAAEAQATKMEAAAKVAATNAKMVAEQGEAAVAQVQAEADAANARAQEELEKVTAEAESASTRVQALVAEETASVDELDAALKAEADAMVSMEEAQTRANQVAADGAVKVSAAAEKSGLASKAAAEQAAVAGDTAEAAKLKAAAAQTTLKEGAAESSGALNGLKSAANVALMATGAAVVGIGYESTKMAMNFDDAALHLVTDAGESQKALKGVESGMLSVSSQTGISATSIANGMYLIESSGYHGAQGLTVLKAAAQGAVVGGADFATMSNAVTSAMKSYGLGADQAVSVTNQLVAITAAGKLHMQDLASSLGSVLPVAASAHLSLAQVGGAIATMTARGTSAQTATQHLALEIRSIEKVGTPAAKEMDRLGLSVTDVQQHFGGPGGRGLTGTLELYHQAIISHMGPAGLVVVKAMNDSKTAAADMKTMLGSMPGPLQTLSNSLMKGSIGSADYAKAIKNMTPAMASQGAEFLNLAKKTGGFNDFLKAGSPAAQTYTAALSTLTGGAVGLSTSLELLGGGPMTDFKRAVTSIGEASKQTSGDVQNWAAMQGNFKTQLDQTKAGLENTGIVIGNMLIPYLQDALGFFQQHTTVLKVLAGVIAAVAVSLSAIAIAIKVAHAATAAWNFASTAAGWIASSAKWVASTVADCARWVATRGAAFVADAAKATAAAAASVAKWIAAGVAWLADSAATVATWLATRIAAYAAEAGAAVISAATTAAAWVAANIAMIAATGGIVLAIGALIVAGVWLYQHWHQVWADIKTAVSDAWNWIKSALSAAWDWIKSTATTIFNAYIDFYKGIWDKAKQLTTDAWNAIKSFLVGIWNDIKAVATTAWNDLKNGIADVWKGIVALFHVQVAAVKAIFVDAPQWLLQAGRDIVNGLINGIKNMAGAAISAVTGLGSDIKSAFHSILHFGSPSKDFAQFGQWIPEGIVNGIIVSRPKAIAEVQKLGAQIAQTHSAALESIVSKTGTTAIKLGTLYDSIVGKLKTAAANLAALQKASADQAASTAATIMQTGDITKMVGATAADGSTGPAAASDMIAGLHQSIATAQQFGQALTQLRKQGLDATSLSQLAAAGPAAGLATAQALLQGGQSAITQVAQLQKQLATTATQSGTQVASAMYGSGISAAQGLVKGLQSQENSVLTQLTSMIAKMVATVKKNLKISSPSQVFADEVGSMIPAGMVKGITAGMPAVASSLSVSPSQFHVGGLPSAAGGGQLTATAPIIVQIDKKVLYQTMQSMALEYGRRNPTTGLSYVPGRAGS